MPNSPGTHKPQSSKVARHQVRPERWGQGRGGRSWRRLREIVFKRDGFMCQPCKRKGRLTPVRLHGVGHGVCGHIVPLSEGGTDDLSNLQTECQACDKMKTAQESRRGRAS